MKEKMFLILRIIYGLQFLVFGLNGFFHFLPMPPMQNDVAGQLMGAFMNTGYFFPVLKGTEVLCGLGILINWFAPLALVIISPVVLQIVLFHAFLAHEGVAMAVVILAMHLTLAFKYREIYKPLLRCC